MSYRDPYYDSQHYQQPYSDNVPEFDPYNNRGAYPTYDQSGYADDEGYPKTNANAKEADLSAGHPMEKGGYESAGLPPVSRPPQGTGAIRIWRKDHYGNLWAKGGRAYCIGRFCCCTILIVLFLLISVVLTLGIWVRPPDVVVNSVGFPTSGSTFQVTSSSLNLNLAVNISVNNPNYFSLGFKDIKVALTYPIDDLAVGGGEKDHITFHAHTQTIFNFPFTLTYTEADDTNHEVLEDILSKCGITGTKEDINVDYKITLGIQILFVTVSPSFSDNFSFECPFDASDLSALLQGSGINITSIVDDFL